MRKIIFLKNPSLEIKHFRNKIFYHNIAKEKDCLLFYIVGCILPLQKVNHKLSLSDVSIDLTMSSFCVPLIGKYSPLAYSIVNEVHKFRSECSHCRYLNKKSIGVAMGPISSDRLHCSCILQMSG